MHKWLSILLLGLTIAGCQSGNTSVFDIEQTPEGYLVKENQQVALFYQTVPPQSAPGNIKSRGHYLHPLTALDGDTLTEDMPADHLHHHGVFWSWHQVWVGDSLIGDPWDIRGWQWNVQNTNVTETQAGVVIDTEVLWASSYWQDENGKPIPLIREHTLITLHHQGPDFRILDFDIRLTALADHMRIGGADNAKGYGGFSVRMYLPQDMQFTGETGTVGPINTPVEGGAWMNFSGTFPGEKPRDLTIMCHPDNPGYPQPWILRRAKSMQNAVWPGRAAQPLSTTGPVELRYRLVIHQGSFDRKLTTQLFEKFSNLGPQYKK